MSWIKPSFDQEEISVGPVVKKPKITNENTVFNIKNEVSSDSSSNDWLQKYKPKKINELGVHISKVKEIQNWLLYSKSKLLLLTGPAGCGKTTTLEVVCKSLGFKILEWITPVDKYNPCDLPQVPGIVKQFEEYLLKTSRYSSCLGSKSHKLVILIKDLPNAFYIKPSSFHEVLENISKMSLLNPIVFICSDKSLCRKLFSAKLPVVRFSPITNLQMLKILKTIISKEKEVNKDIETLCDMTLCAINSSGRGDIRHCVSELYFRCVRPSTRTFAQSQASPPYPVTPDSKDSQLDFFQGIGKVFSPEKRREKEMCKFATTPESIVERFLGEAKDFVGRLNENFYTQFNSMYDLRNAAHHLSISDVFLSRWHDKDIFSEYSLSVAVRGLMVSNSNPQPPRFQLYGKSNTRQSLERAEHVLSEGKFMFPSLCTVDNQCLHDYLIFAKHLMGENLDHAQKTYLKKINLD